MPGGKLEGKIVSITAEGDVVSDITAEQLRLVPRGEQTSIVCDEHETRGIFSPEHQEPACTLLAILNPAGQLQLTIVGDSARDMLGLRVGMPIELSW